MDSYSIYVNVCNCNKKQFGMKKKMRVNVKQTGSIEEEKKKIETAELVLSHTLYVGYETARLHQHEKKEGTIAPITET